MPRRPTLDVEIIEVLDPDDLSLPWSGAAFAPVADRRRPRDVEPTPPRHAWVWVLAAFSVLIVSVVALVLFSAEQRPTPEPLAVGRYLPVGPTVALRSAEVVEPAASPDTFRMWADNSQPGGAWVSVEVTRPHVAPLVVRDATARTVNGVQFAVLDHDELLATTRDFGSGWVGEVRLRGIDPTVAATMVQRLHLDLTYSGDAVVDLDNARLAGLRLEPVVAADRADTALLGTVTSEVHAISRDVEYTLRVADGDAASRVDNLRFLASGPITMVNDVAVTTLWGSGDAIAVWGVDGRVLSLTAHTDTMMVAALAGSVQPATVKEWTAATRDLAVKYHPGDAQPLASGTDSAGDWTAGAQLAGRPGDDQLLWWATVPGDRSQVVTVPATPLQGDRTTDRIVVGGQTYVFVQSRRLGGVDRAVVSVDGHHEVDVPLVPAFGNGRLLVGAVRLDVQGKVTVILGIVPGS